mgnify:CR=1 FL=1
MLYVAHRGVCSRVKENSLEAINLAIYDDKYHGVEIDVQLCKSGELVLHHDLYLHSNWIKDLTYEELKLYDIISLKDLYDKVPFVNEKMLIIDIKGNDYKIIEELNIFYSLMCTKHVYFCSFNRPMLNDLNPKFKIGRTFEAFFSVDEYPVIFHNIDLVILHWTCLNHTLINYCKSNNICVFTYTHKNALEHRHMSSFEIDGIITNGI